MPELPFEQQVTFFYTRDLEMTAHFYEDVLKLPLVLDQGVCRIYQVCSNAFVGFCKRDDAPSNRDDAATRHVIFTLVTSAVDSWYEYLVNRDVAFEKPPTQNNAYNIYHCFLRDPNGYLIEIQQFLDPTWPKAVSHQEKRMNDG